MSGFQVQVFDIALEKDVYREGEHVIGNLTVVNEEEIKIKCKLIFRYWLII